MAKKGDLSMGVIIGAAIALLILVLLSVLVFKAGWRVTEGTSCYGMNEDAACITEGESCGDLSGGGLTYVYNRGGECGGTDKCCIPLGG